MGRFIDLTNKRFSRLIVLKKYGHNKYNQITWLCKCDCGNLIIVSGNSLTRNNTRSCGCLYQDYLHNPRPNTQKHGKSNSRLYHIWRDMKLRCYNEKQIGYKNYGARGIKVCDEWLNKTDGFVNFYKWSINNGYKENLTLDRINNDGNYEPTNCKWSTTMEQANNTRSNRFITYKNKTKTIAEWSRELNIPHYLIRNRLNMGWAVENIFERKVGKNGRRGKRTNTND